MARPARTSERTLPELPAGTRSCSRRAAPPRRHPPPDGEARPASAIWIRSRYNDPPRGEADMFIAMNRFKVKKGSEQAFENVWMTRESTYLDRMQGFVEFHLLKGPEAEDHTLYSSHTVWASKADSRPGPSRRNSAPRTPGRQPPPARSISSIRSSRASRCARPSPARTRRRNRRPATSRALAVRHPSCCRFRGVAPLGGTNALACRPRGHKMGA